jgi:hypothetical protein
MNIDISKPHLLHRKREKRESEEVAIDSTYEGGHKLELKFSATKVPRQCPLVLLVKIGQVKVRRFEAEKVKR